MKASLRLTRMTITAQIEEHDMTEPTPAQQAAAFADHLGGSYGNPEHVLPDADTDSPSGESDTN